MPIAGASGAIALPPNRWYSPRRHAGARACYEAIREDRMPSDSAENISLEHYPYPSRRMPIVASRGVVATSEPLAAQAGLLMLQKGGNAVDAALATAIALTVIEPTSNGIGSDAFAIVWDGKKLHGLNGSGRAPAALTPEIVRAT